MPRYMTTLLPSFYVFYNPSGYNSTVCTDFLVYPSQTRTVAVYNIPPPSELSRTIRFCKNCASCAASKGKQKPCSIRRWLPPTPRESRSGR